MRNFIFENLQWRSNFGNTPKQILKIEFSSNYLIHHEVRLELEVITDENGGGGSKMHLKYFDNFDNEQVKM